MICVFDSHSEVDTVQLGRTLAALVVPGLTVALNGELGAGKTFFVRSLCQGLGIDTARVNSPTFVLLQLYTDGRIPVAHFDTWRLADADEFLAIGGDEYLNGDEYLCLVEWADRISEILPGDRLSVSITQTAPTARRFEFLSSGPVSDDLVRRLQHVLA